MSTADDGDRDPDGPASLEMNLEVVVIAVSDVDRAKAFYSEQLGFNVDVDYQPNEHFRVVQLTPPGSACSITIGVGVSRFPAMTRIESTCCPCSNM